MNILILGGGGREHAIAWKVSQSDQVKNVYVAPGNAGTDNEKKAQNVDLSIHNHDALVEFVKSKEIALTIVGPEAPLVEGVVDRFDAENLACFGPTQAAAQLEGSKAYCKAFLKKHQIPTASYQSFESIDPAIAYLESVKYPVVIKADGLAAGKGVVIAQTQKEASDTLEDMLEGNRFGEAGHRVVIEEFLEGEEASFICMIDGETVLPLATSQDHKARDDGDQGPNTGGMGAYSPAPIITAELHQRVLEKVFYPTLNGLKQEGILYKGFLYAGLMIDNKGEPKVLEFNCRFGDPETQPILMRLQSSLAELCLAGCEGRLKDMSVEWDPRAALGVVMAAGGYPSSYRKGDKINGLDQIQEYPDAPVKVFHAGTKKENQDVTTNGGRVLCVTALGKTLSDAQKTAYQKVAQINWPNAYYRKDIGHKGLA